MESKEKPKNLWKHVDAAKYQLYVTTSSTDPTTKLEEVDERIVDVNDLEKRRDAYGICGECNEPGTGENWCRNCNSKRLESNFKNWTSGNELLDEFIQQSQINAVHCKKCLEWIPFEKFQEIKYITKGGFGKIYSAKWPQGFIRYWDIENQKWDRETNVKVALKSLDNSSDFLSPIKFYLQIYCWDIVPCYGITQDPNTEDYMIVLKFCNDGNLRSQFKKNYLSYNFKIHQLSLIARGLLDIHNAGKVHKNFHSGNILFSDSEPFISDLGMCGSVNSKDQSTKEGVYGVLSYMAPEIIHGFPYTKAADIYSFGIIINEFMSEKLPYSAYADDPLVGILAFRICRGLRPIISEETPKLIADLITKCWDAEAENRPTANELYQILKKWDAECDSSDDEYDIDSEIYTQINECEKKLNYRNKFDNNRNKFDNYQTRPQAIYTSRLLSFKDLILDLIESPTKNTRSDDKIVSMNTNIGDIIPWSDTLEVFLCELYLRDDIADIFWGRRFEEHNAGSTIWQIYVVTRLFCPYIGSKFIDGQLIHFIEEAAGFSNAERLPQNSYDLLPTWKKVPQDLQMAFDKALENELGKSFRDAHYNLVGMSTGYKRTGGKFTTTPAIILYVRQKGILRRGCNGQFPKNICGYPTDIVEACLATSCGQNYHGEELCQRYQTDAKLGSSIGIGLTGSEKTTGTLGAVVRERSSNRIGILSCEHVLKFKETNVTKEIIHQPSREDLLGKPQRRLTDLINQSKERGARMEDFEDDIEAQRGIVDRAKRKKSELATYERGIRENVFLESEHKCYGVDAAFGILLDNGRKLHTRKFAINSDYFEKANLSGGTCLEGAYTHEELKSKNFDQVFKVGRTTGLTVGKYISSDSSIAIDLGNDIIKYGKECEMEIKNIYLDKFIGYLKASVHEEIRERHQQCYPTKWFDRQIMFHFRPEEFKCGDSGASVVDENGMALGLLHAEWKTAIYTCGIASPYFAIFESLNVELC